MCGIFATTDPGLLAHRALVERCLERRGTEKPVWRTTESGCVLAHCLLPVRGETPVLQPAQTGERLLLYSGELWDVESGRSDTIAWGERIGRLGLKAAVARSQ